MEQGLMRNWPLISLVAAAGLAISVFNMIMKPTNLGLIHAEDFNYEMLRPDSMKAKYDLSGREVVRTIHSVEGQTPVKNAAPVAAAAAAKPATPSPAVAQAQAKAQLDAKKKQEEARKAAQAAARKKAEISVRAQAANSNRSGLKPLETSTGNRTAPVAVAAVPPVAVASDSQDPVADERLKLSPGQWRSLLQGQPSPANAAAFVAAFRSGDVDRSTFFTVAKELVSDSSEDRRRTGLQILKDEPSVESFMILVAEYKDPAQTEIYEALKSYAQPARLGYLRQVMTSSDKRSVKMATQILAKVVETAVAGVQTNLSARDTRTPGSTPQLSPAQLRMFIPVLDHLTTQSGNPELAAEAQALKQKIQSLKLA